MAYTELCGSKLRSKLGSTLNESVSAPVSSFAQRQLVKMGWREGSGLGKNSQGMSSHIKVKKREEELGLGATNTDLPNSDEWWNNSVADTLSRLSSSNKKKIRKKVKKFTDDELFRATGGARFGMRAQRRSEGKWARSEKSTESQENEALKNIEWNGLGKACTVKDGKKRKRTEETTFVKTTDSDDSKKKRKDAKKEIVESTSMSSLDNGPDTDVSVSEKRKKKKKKSSRQDKAVEDSERKRKKKRRKKS